MIPKFNEKELLLAIAEGDEYAFVVIFRHYQDHIFKVALQFLKSQELAEEAMQEIFIKVWEQRKKLPGLASFQNWLFIVSKNLLLNAVRKMARDREIRNVWKQEHPLNENSTDYKLREARFSDILQQIIISLPQSQRSVFELAKQEFLTYDEIAQRLSLSPNTVRIHMSRALHAIRQSLKEYGIEFLLILFLQHFF